jgi:hypothetical protein
MRILEHEVIGSDGGDKHQRIIIEWFNREWKILLNDNHKTKMTTAYLEDNGWRRFDNRTLEESIIFDHIKQEKIVKLKYKVQ